MSIQINGTLLELKAGVSIYDMLDQRGIDPNRVVIELNKNIIPKEVWSSVILHDNDIVEILHFVGGG